MFCLILLWFYSFYKETLTQRHSGFQTVKKKPDIVPISHIHPLFKANTIQWMLCALRINMHTHLIANNIAKLNEKEQQWSTVLSPYVP